MLHNTLAYIECEVEPVETGIALFEQVNNAQRVQVVLKGAAKPAHLLVQFAFAHVPERRMAEVVGKSMRLCVFLVETQRDGRGARDLGDFNRVGESISRMVIQ